MYFQKLDCNLSKPYIIPSGYLNESNMEHNTSNSRLCTADSVNAVLCCP